MRITLITTILAVMALLLLAACPREEIGDDSSANPEGRKPDFSQQDEQPADDAEADTAADASDTDAGDATATEDDAGAADGDSAPADADATAEGDDAGTEDTATEDEAAADDGAAAEADETIADANGSAEDTTVTDTEATEPKADVTTVVFETTKGDIVMEVHPEWSPLGAAHFLDLVRAGFYDGAPWFRVVEGFVAQAGVAADPEMNEKWGTDTIMDEPVIKGNKPGFVSFGKSRLPNSRSTHIFINLVDNSGGLDPKGFSAFAEVVEGMDVAKSLARVEYKNQAQLAAPGGLESFKNRFPEADYITKAYIKEGE
jgi:cyclophilin family peptidyl-prolyl cis-trans isomerase